jgi:hypothetical protein
MMPQQDNNGHELLCAPLVALEVDHIHRIKSYESHEKPDVRFSQLICSDVAPLAENALNAVQGACESGTKSFLVRHSKQCCSQQGGRPQRGQDERRTKELMKCLNIRLLLCCEAASASMCVLSCTQ